MVSECFAVSQCFVMLQCFVVSECFVVSLRFPVKVWVRGGIARKRGDMATAYKHSRFCIAYTSDSQFFWCDLGVLYYKNDRVAEAIVALQRALY
jgi:hypothetical protein